MQEIKMFLKHTHLVVSLGAGGGGVSTFVQSHHIFALLHNRNVVTLRNSGNLIGLRSLNVERLVPFFRTSTSFV